MPCVAFFALQDYARRRCAFGAPLIRQPLAQRALAWLHLHTAGSLALTLEVARLLGEPLWGQHYEWQAHSSAGNKPSLLGLVGLLP